MATYNDCHSELNINRSIRRGETRWERKKKDTKKRGIGIEVLVSSALYILSVIDVSGDINLFYIVMRIHHPKKNSFVSKHTPSHSTGNHSPSRS